MHKEKMPVDLIAGLNISLASLVGETVITKPHLAKKTLRGGGKSSLKGWLSLLLFDKSIT